MKRVLLVRYKYSFKPQYVEVSEEGYSILRQLKQGTPCLVAGDRGDEFVMTVRPSRPAADAEFPTALPKFLRLATDEDRVKEAANIERERSSMATCRQKVKEKKMDVKVVYVEYSFDASKAWVHFMAESRADTREISKDVSEALGLKAEWKQIGARDQAAMVGGMGPCGRELCCTTFLKDYPAVSMRKAKEQNIPMNPNKLNGMCGRLKCCVAYEWGMSATGCEEHGSCERKYEPPVKEGSEGDAAQSQKS